MAKKEQQKHSCHTACQIWVLLESQHWLGASENISEKVFDVQNFCISHSIDLKCYFSQHV